VGRVRGVTDWDAYHRGSVGLPPRALLLEALQLHPAPGYALDLGCGTGRDTRHLLAKGWSVLAIDSQSPALDLLLDQIPDDSRARCEVRCVALEEAKLPPADLVNAAFSLPFCNSASGPLVWSKIRAALRPGGIFVGQLFGPRDAWASEDIWTVSREEVDAMLSGWEVNRLTEIEEERRTAAGEMKWTHVYDVIVGRPTG
jgi:tellurite methyltransferase